ncbi:uncharacterized protein BDZ99DRAFT_66084 [Mytilinidion resinicola]|uniref:Uncharacterized protein n=1 Tax=Mytilinidion resinicola TaxID=574789 RepID=A0A6A6YIP2_9PEZI|nr:uncharacterized protein BDZ99DRAFT_66084 [Mytilinidion resinicola]KAF2807797.1 hypothetical protein BDZ99DRAFT_66084 [Mytilinidion resinicola]
MTRKTLRSSALPRKRFPCPSHSGVSSVSLTITCMPPCTVTTFFLVIECRKSLETEDPRSCSHGLVPRTVHDPNRPHSCPKVSMTSTTFNYLDRELNFSEASGLSKIS